MSTKQRGKSKSGSGAGKTPAKKKTAPAAGKKASANGNGSHGASASERATSAARLRLMERRKHPRFLLSREQFRENKTGRIFQVYDLSMNGLSVRIDAKHWEPGTIIAGVLNLHPDSIELTPRLVGYYGDRAALKLEVASTYARSVLQRALSPRRLGSSLQLVREKLPLADYWYHGVCNTDLLLRLNPTGDVAKIEMFFANYYWSWAEHSDRFTTGVCQSFGREQREDQLLAVEPVKIEQIDLTLDSRADAEKTRWARGILEAAPLDPRLKGFLLKKFDSPA